METLVDEALRVVLDDGSAFRMYWTGGVHVGATVCLFTGCVGCVNCAGCVRCEAAGLVEPFAVVGVGEFAVVGVGALAVDGAKAYGRGVRSGAGGRGFES